MPERLSAQERAASIRLARAGATYRIVAFGDSLSLPRIKGDDRVLWEETWPYLLERELSVGGSVEVINSGKRARTIDSLVLEFPDEVVFKHPDAIIVQIGITDCAPRIFSRNENRLLNSTLVPERARRWIIKRRTQQRAAITARQPLAKVYTPPEAFERYLNQFASLVSELHWRMDTVVLPILAYASACESKSRGHTENVARFNDLLRAAATRMGAAWLPLDGLGPDDRDAFCSDGYHLSVEGNRRLATNLATWFQGRVARRVAEGA